MGRLPEDFVSSEPDGTGNPVAGLPCTPANALPILETGRVLARKTLSVLCCLPVH